MYQCEDSVLGEINVKRHSRAKRVIARYKSGALHITIPKWLSLKQVPVIIEEMRPGLLKLLPDKSLIITEETQLKTLTFNTRVQRTTITKVAKMQLNDGWLNILLPVNWNIESVKAQESIKKLTIEAMRHEAKRVLVPRTVSLAEKHNLQFNNIRISRSVTRWGSCSSKKNINLSLFLMLLPQRYIDYVILHELAHTVEMNHSVNFWNLLTKLCAEDAKSLSREVRNYKSLEKQFLMES